MENLTTEEKIDYIYNTLKKQERRYLIKSIFRILFLIAIVSYLVYFYLYGFDLLIDYINQTVKANLNIDASNTDFDINKEILIETLNKITNNN